MKEVNLQNDPIKSPEIQEIILSNRIGIIAAELSKRLDISPIRALDIFYTSPSQPRTDLSYRLAKATLFLSRSVLAVRVKSSTSNARRFHPVTTDLGLPKQEILHKRIVQ